VREVAAPAGELLAPLVEVEFEEPKAIFTSALSLAASP
jgi:hypothetical protein